ncbi:MAG: IPT/TIG domain-containing protein [Spirochaetales bacterium]|nr:IPT/TIG domain-containing protein [Spirochaetales bacterium]
MVPGTYTAVLIFANRGNRDVDTEILLNITLAYPAVVVNGVYPEKWNNLDGPEINVFGENFLSGTKLYFDETELAITDNTGLALKADIPQGVQAGEHEIMVMGPNGDVGIKTVTVVEPFYVVIGYKTETFAMAGESAQFILGIKGAEGFTGSASFEVHDVPSGWSAVLNRNIIGVEETAVLTVTIPYTEGLGTKTLTLISDQGDVLPITVNVAAEYPAPHISSLSLLSGMSGDELIIYGYGFGENGKVMIGETELPIEYYSKDLVKARITAIAVTGQVTLVRDGLTSNSVIFYVKNRGFNLYPEKTEMVLKAGESAENQIIVSGYSEPVYLSMESDNPEIMGFLSTSTITPNGSVKLSVTAFATAASGTYPISVTGSCGDLTITKIIDVVIGDAFAFTTQALPKGMESTDYSFVLLAENGSGTVVFALESGSLPTGLILAENGTISGRPVEPGISLFTVKATDAEDRIRIKEFSIAIEENAWSHDNKDAGNTRYNPVKAPADDRTDWISNAFTGAKEILTGYRRIFVLNDTEISGLDKDKGILMYRVPGSFSNWAYSAGLLFCLDNESEFKALDSFTGNMKWSRQSISNFVTDGNTLLLESGNTIMVVDPSDGTLLSEIQANLPYDASYVYQNAVCHKVEGSSVFKLTDSGWQTVFSDQIPITDIAADSLNMAVLTSGGRLTLLAPDYQIALQIETNIVSGRIVFGSEKVLVFNDYSTACFYRTDLSFLYTKSIQPGQIGFAKEKLFVTGDDGLKAINGYSGSVIWQMNIPTLDLCIAGEKLYALSADGRVFSYGGPDNISAPVTALVSVPSQPDGTNGYYKTQPTVRLVSYDPETYVQAVRYRYGSNSLTLYEGPITLPEGQYSFLWYGTDSAGLKEQDRIVYFRIDSHVPVSTLNLTGTQGTNGYFLSPVTVTLMAQDDLSGVSLIQYRINGGEWLEYGGAFTLNVEGSYDFAYRAIDTAGNEETARSVHIQLDLNDPVVNARLYQIPGMAAVVLTASDSLSGINRIDYSLDNGIFMFCDKVIIVTQPGAHTIGYRAVDGSGRMSEIKQLAFEVTAPEEQEWVRDLEFDYPSHHRKVIRDVKPGIPLYSPSHGRNNEIKALPSYILGADFIQLSLEDKNAKDDDFITFMAGVDVDVYILKHAKSGADLAGWTLVEKNYPVEPRKYFKSGADVYKRHYIKGEKVNIPGSNAKQGWVNLVFVQYAESNNLAIILPSAGEVFYPNDSLEYIGSMVTGQPVTYRWSYRIDGDWVTLPASGTYGTLTLPFVEKTSAFYLNVEALDINSNVIAVRTETYTLKNEFDVYLIDPGPGTEVVCGSTVVLDYTALDARGATIDNEDILWAYSTDGKNWTGITDDTFLAPATPQTITLKAETESLPGKTQTVSYTLYTVDDWTPVTIAFGRGTNGEYTLGEVETIHASGKQYGFNVDHTDQSDTFRVFKRFHGWDKYSNISLKKDGSFSYSSGNGVFRVKAVFGPALPWQDYQGTIENYMFTTHTYGWERLYVVETVLTVTDGKITIKGDEGLPIVSLTIERLREKPPDESPPGRRKPGKKKHEKDDWKGGRK